MSGRGRLRDGDQGAREGSRPARDDQPARRRPWATPPSASSPPSVRTYVLGSGTALMMRLPVNAAAEAPKKPPVLPGDTSKSMSACRALKLCGVNALFAELAN